MRNQSEKVSEIIKRIKDYLESECITQSYIAKKMGYHTSTVSKILNEDQKLSLEFLLDFFERICKDEDKAFYIFTGKNTVTQLMKELCSVEKKEKIQSFMDLFNQLLSIITKYQKKYF